MPSLSFKGNYTSVEETFKMHNSNELSRPGKFFLTYTAYSFKKLVN